jgi:predicted Zn-dependent protease
MLQRNGKIEEVTRSEDISIGLTAYSGQKKSSISTSNLTSLGYFTIESLRILTSLIILTNVNFLVKDSTKV